MTVLLIQWPANRTRPASGSYKRIGKLRNGALAGTRPRRGSDRRQRESAAPEVVRRHGRARMARHGRPPRMSAARLARSCARMHGVQIKSSLHGAPCVPERPPTPLQPLSRASPLLAVIDGERPPRSTPCCAEDVKRAALSANDSSALAHPATKVSKRTSSQRMRNKSLQGSGRV